MQSHKVYILIAATLIAIGQHSCQALTCSTGGSATANCGDGVTQCYTKLDSGNVTRGCLKDVTCTQPSCQVCGTDNCNAFLMCKQCDGSQAGCATLVGDTNYQQCSTATQLCLNQLNENGTVTRGCGEPCASGAANCESCKSDVCNGLLYPAGRRLCYQCSGANCETLDNSTTLLPCAIYQASAQKCYTIGTSATTMQRGCQVDAGSANKCAGATPDASCAICSDQDGCNNSPYQRVLGSCIKCNDTSACVGAQTDAKPVDCAPAVYTQTANSCYTQLATNGSVLRGCTNELNGAACNPADSCSTCVPSGCNSEAGVLQCLVCRSDNYGPCRIAAVGSSPCHSANAGNQCFSGEWDGVVVRGCLADAGALMRYQCKDVADTRCETCTGMDCNVKKYNGAGALQHMGFGLLGLIFVVRQLAL